MTWTNKNRQMTYPSVIAINVKKFARNYGFQKQSSRGVLKICSKFTREHPMRKCDFNKVEKQFFLKHTSVWVLSCKFAEYFQNTFS